MASKSSSQNARALERLRLRRRRRGRERLRPQAAPGAPAESVSRELAGGMFLETLVLTFPHRHKRRWLTVPVAATVHVAILAGLIVVPIALVKSPTPALVPLFLDWAPPPPPPLKRGTPLRIERPQDAVPKQTGEDKEAQKEEPRPLTEDRLSFPMEIPEEILKPNVALEYGVEEGSDFGHPFGMEGGVPGGVVGGVPGGILGGVIGGTGRGVPRRFPQPDVGPQPLRQPKPPYTVEAIRKKVSGEVVLQALIDVRGRVKVLQVLHSIPELDQEAIRVVENEWLFRPAMKSGRPVECLVELVVQFNLY